MMPTITQLISQRKLLNLFLAPRRCCVGFTCCTVSTVTIRAIRWRRKLVHVESIAVPYTDFGSTITARTNGCLTNLALHPPFTNYWVFTIHPEGKRSSTLVHWYTRGGQLSPCSSHEPVPAVEVEDVITDRFADFVVYRAITIFEDLIIATLIRSCKKK